VTETGTNSRTGCAMVAAHVLETVGTQEYVLEADPFVKRFAEAYGEDAADEVRPHMPQAVPTV